MAKKSHTFKGQAKPYGQSGHFHEPRRHSLQARGIKTGNLANYRVLWDEKMGYMWHHKGEKTSMRKGFVDKQEAEAFAEKLRQDPEHLDVRIVKGKPMTESEREVAKVLLEVMDEESEGLKKLFGKYYHGDEFDDVMIFTDKVMEYETSDDPSRGWNGVMGYIDDKPEDSRSVLLVTYDGAGYDYFSDRGDYVHGITKKRFKKALKKKFGDKYYIEDATNWAFEVYEN